MKSVIKSAVLPRVQSREIFLALGFTVLTVAAAKFRVPLPFSPVPVTLQTMVAVLAGMLLGKKLGALSQVQYLVLGLAGAPVFANAPFGGPAALASPSFGYIPGFILGAYVSGWAWEKLGARGPKAALVSAALGGAAIYAVGVPWLACWLKATTAQSAAVCASQALLMGLVPFIGADALKTTAAAVIASGKRSI